MLARSGVEVDAGIGGAAGVRLKRKRSEYAAAEAETPGDRMVPQPLGAMALAASLSSAHMQNTGFIGSTSGISFAKLMLTAVRDAESSHTSPDRAGEEPQREHAQTSPHGISSAHPLPETTQTDNAYYSADDEYTPPTIQEAAAMEDVYFRLSAVQHPIMFRAAFNKLMEEYVKDPVSAIGRPSEFFVNMVFAIACACKQRQHLPEMFYRRAMGALSSVASEASGTAPGTSMFVLRTQMLQAILLISVYSLMRTTVPGPWYVVGVALRLSVDMGLHHETPQYISELDSDELDLNRRLMWTAYSLDRQICVYLGRPFGIADADINTQMPSLSPDEMSAKSDNTKLVTRRMIEIRRMQSELQGVLYRSNDVPRAFDSLQDWQNNMNERLHAWHRVFEQPQESPTNGSGGEKNPLYVELNYQQSRLLLFGLSPAIPTPLSDQAFLEIASASAAVIETYAMMGQKHCINYVWLAVHNVFMAGVSFLYVIWHCESARNEYYSLEQVEHTSSQCKQVLNSLKSFSTSASTALACFENMANETVLRYRKRASVNEETATKAMTPFDSLVLGRPFDGDGTNGLLEGLENVRNVSAEDYYQLVELGSAAQIWNEFFTSSEMEENSSIAELMSFFS